MLAEHDTCASVSALYLPPQINEKYKKKAEYEIIEINQHNNTKLNEKQQNLMTMRNVFAVAL